MTHSATALSDFKKVYKEISPELRQKLLEKKLLYTRTQRRVGTKYTHDVADMKGWPEIFKTDSKAEVEKMCSVSGDNKVQWIGPNKDIFQSTCVSEAFQLHPDTNEPVWYNHSQVFHWTTFPAELYIAFQRTKDIRYLLHCLFAMFVSVVKCVVLGHKMSLDCSFGDGTPISIKEMHEIRSAVHKHMVLNRWQRGDILLIDNFGTSHGRQPTYDSGRKVVVSWSNPVAKQNLLTMIGAPVIGVGEVDVASFELNPEDLHVEQESAKGVLCATVELELTKSSEDEDQCFCNPQERTLTAEDHNALKEIFPSSTQPQLSHSRSSPLVVDKTFWQVAKKEV
jgi:hypothetical protein